MAVKTYQDSKDKYLREKVDTFVLRVPKGKKDEIMEYAKSKGMSLNGYITELIFADMGQIEKKSDASKVKKETKKQPVKTTSKPSVKKEKAPAPVKNTPVKEEIVKEIPIQETEIQETEIKKKKMPSFLL